MNWKIKQKTKGLTLVEIIVVISIFVVGLGAMLTSAVALFTKTRFSGDFLIATNLAREGIEKVRAIREINFLNSGDSGWDDSISFDAAILKPMFVSQEFSGDYDFAPVTYTLDQCMDGSAGEDDCHLYFDEVSGIYGDPGTEQVIKALQTKFYRMITLIPRYCTPAFDTEGLCTYDAAPVNNEKIAIAIVSEVKWYDGSNLRSVRAETTIFNWQ